MAHRFTVEQIGAITKQVRANRAVHDVRLHTRRLLIEMAEDAYDASNLTGTYVIPPFNKSSMIIQVMIGEVARGVQQYAGMISSNPPRFIVPPIAIDRPDVAKSVDRRAAEQAAERPPHGGHAIAIAAEEGPGVSAIATEPAIRAPRRVASRLLLRL